MDEDYREENSHVWWRVEQAGHNYVKNTNKWEVIKDYSELSVDITHDARLSIF